MNGKALTERGGVWNGSLFGSNGQLSLSNSLVSGNLLAGSPGSALQGGGLFTTLPVTLAGTLIKGNQPDQCVGTAC